MSQIPRVVFDTQIYLRALINYGSGAGKLVLELREDYELVTCRDITNEVMDVLTRSSIRKKYPQISSSDVESVENILSLAILVEVQQSDIEPICRDPKDDIFLACAKVAKADYLVSEDNDLLVIGQHHTTRIVKVATFLSNLEQKRD